MSYDYDRITERLFCGSLVRSQDDVDELVRAGVTHIIDCCETDDRVDLGGRADVALLWDPTADDGKTKGVDWFAPAVDFAAGALAHPKYIVHTHCAAGVNRGPSIAYAILRSQGIDPQLAFLMLKKARPQVNVAYRNDADAALLFQGWTR